MWPPEPKFRDRFQRETLLMARFAHPYAVTLYDASLTDGPCIVMEYIRGVNLESPAAEEHPIHAGPRRAVDRLSCAKSSRRPTIRRSSIAI